MKSIGIIRRIDELGRIVIPKELRKNLHIKDGENMEIFIDTDKIVLKKHTPITSINNLAENVVGCLYAITRNSIFICDNEKVLIASNDMKDEFVGKKISENLEKIINDRKIYIGKDNIEVIENITSKVPFVVNPIIVDSDVIGAICIFGKESENYIREIKLMSKFLEVSLYI